MKTNSDLFEEFHNISSNIEENLKFKTDDGYKIKFGEKYFIVEIIDYDYYLYNKKSGRKTSYKNIGKTRILSIGKDKKYIKMEKDGRSIDHWHYDGVDKLLIFKMKPNKNCNFITIFEKKKIISNILFI